MSRQQSKLVDYLYKHNSRVLFLNGEGEGVSYSEVTELGSNPAFQLSHRRLVFCLTENDLGGLAGYLGLLVSEAIPLMLGAGVASSQLNELVAAYRPGYIWLPSSRRDEFLGKDCLITYRNYCLLDLGNQAYAIHDSLALLLTTSGSTGSPKFVRLSYENVLSNARSIVQYLDLTSDEIPITTLPPSYTYGLSIIHSHILVGATIATTDKTFFDRSFWDFLRNVKATSFGGVPYHYEILKKLRFTTMDLPHLRTLTQAGGRMDPALTKEYAVHCASRGMRFFTMYGQAEATARMSYLPPEKTISKAGSIGIAIPGGKFWLEDEEGQRITGDNISGELVYEGPNVSMGYAHGFEDLAKGDERQGILRTGDLAKLDQDGDYYIVGRLKRFLKLFGHRVNLLDIEEFLLNEGHVAACAGHDDLLEIYLPEGSLGQAKLIKKLVVQNLKIAPKGVVVYGINALPRNDSGKVQYAVLKPENGTCLA